MVADDDRAVDNRSGLGFSRKEIDQCNRMNSPGKLIKKWLNENNVAQKILKGEIQWGNLAPSTRKHKSTTPRSASTRKTPKAPHPSPWPSPPSTGTRALEKFKTPKITNPRDLLTHFPIDLLRVRDSDILAVVWNTKLLKQWKNERPSSYDEHLEYEMYTEYRLVHTLRQHKDMFEILAPKHEDEIVRIRFNPPRSPPVRLVRREDIYKQFPVIVDRREGRPGEATFGIMIRGDYKRGRSADEIARMTADLMRALHASKYWKVLPPARDDELCRIEMTHA